MHFSARNILYTLLIAGSVIPLSAQQRPAWSGYLNGEWSESIQASALDRDGGLWVAGSSASASLLTGPNDPFQAEKKGTSDAFLAKLKPEADGRTTVLYWTWLGGSADEEVRAMTLDSRGRVYLVGATTSSDFPVAGNGFKVSQGGEKNAFVAVFDPALSGEFSLSYAASYGGAKDDVATAVAVDARGVIAVAGSTLSPDLPGVEASLQSTNRGGGDLFVMYMDPLEAISLRYVTYLGGGSTDYPTGAAFDRAGVIWVSGYTFSDNFPITGNGYQTEMRSSADGFLVAIDTRRPGLDAHVYGSYLGGGDLDVPQQLVVDTDGTFWIAGYTFSKDLPVTSDAAQAANRGLINAFVMHLDLARPPAAALLHSTYFGGGYAEILYGFALLGSGKVAISGYTMSGDLPIVGNPLQHRPRSVFADAFIAVINTRAAGAAGLEYSTYFGGSYNDIASSVSADANGRLFVAGYTASNDLPVTDGTSRSKSAAQWSGFVLSITR